MKMILYRSSAEAVRVNKEEFLEPIAFINGTLKNSTSINNPTFIINSKNLIMAHRIADSDGIAVTDGENPVSYFDTSEKLELLNVNYIYIEEFNRYYFITDIVSISLHEWAIACSVDVLMSFKDEILSLNALVERNEYDYDEFIPDSELIPLEEPFISVEEYANSSFPSNNIVVTTLVK